MKINLPTAKELGIDIKQILKKFKFKTYNEFKSKYSRIFCIKLKLWLTNKNAFNEALFKKIYKIMFYYNFVEYKQIMELSALFNNKSYVIKLPNLSLDKFFGVDLVIKNDLNKFFIQVKTSQFNYANFNKLITLSINQNGTPVIAIKKGDKWSFKNLLNNEQLFLL
ncbi:ExiS [Mycoplasmopsis maculosa]|uniref:ExiS n=1 Tax=Mycoplasmopsis maculosa TaxID=114885 RepID=A0A449B4Q7_9BACT|nr:hypothetical protein [Mycoplasmopsis maculosa]VEU75593.1 ExiS [Mycoplasmopsis maculosa]